MFLGSVDPVCSDQLSLPVASFTAKMRPPSVAAITRPCETAGDE
jgi:hypothetical protein